jgi:hypothetical protein
MIKEPFVLSLYQLITLVQYICVPGTYVYQVRTSIIGSVGTYEYVLSSYYPAESNFQKWMEDT